MIITYCKTHSWFCGFFLECNLLIFQNKHIFIYEYTPPETISYYFVEVVMELSAKVLHL